MRHTDANSYCDAYYNGYTDPIRVPSFVFTHRNRYHYSHYTTTKRNADSDSYANCDRHNYCCS